MRANLYINTMDKSELIESLKNTTGNAIDIVSDYVPKSIVPTPDKTIDICIIRVRCFDILLF